MADLSTEQLEAMFKKVLEPVTVALDSLQLGEGVTVWLRRAQLS